MGRLVPPFPSCIPSLLLRPGAPDLSPAGPGFDEAPPQGVRRTLPLLITPSIINSGRCLHNEGLPLFTELPRRVVFSETCIHTPAHLYGTGGMRAELRLFSELPIRLILGNRASAKFNSRKLRASGVRGSWKSSGVEWGGVNYYAGQGTRRRGGQPFLCLSRDASPDSLSIRSWHWLAYR